LGSMSMQSNPVYNERILPIPNDLQSKCPKVALSN